MKLCGYSHRKGLIYGLSHRAVQLEKKSELLGFDDDDDVDHNDVNDDDDDDDYDDDDCIRCFLLLFCFLSF